MAEVTLKWELVSKNYDELISKYTKEELKMVGIKGHCDMCILKSGMMCVKRSICRIPQNEVWTNKKISEI